MRVYNAQIADGATLQVARPLDEVDRTLHRMGIYLLIIGLGGIGIASALGLLVAQATLRPVGQLTEVAEEVTETRDLSRRIRVGSRDELGRLASAFNAMLEALDSSLRSQRQLVADASHELRTPLASLRTNIEVLAGGKQLPEERAEEAPRRRDRSGRRALDPRRSARRARSGRAARAGGRAAGRGGRHRSRPRAAALAEGRVPGAPLRVRRSARRRSRSTGPWRTCSTTRRSGATRWTSPSRGTPSPCVTTAPGSRPRISPTSSTASIARPRRASCPARDSGSRSSSRSRRPTAGVVTAENAPDGGAVFRLRLGS